MKVEVNIETSLMVGFGWTNSQGVEQWALIKYERLSDFRYRCGKLGHATEACLKKSKCRKPNLDIQCTRHG